MRVLDAILKRDQQLVKRSAGGRGKTPFMMPDANIAVVHLVAVHNAIFGEGDNATPPTCCEYGDNDPEETVRAVQYAFTVQCAPKLCDGSPVEEVEYAQEVGIDTRTVGDVGAEAAKQQEQVVQAEQEQIKELAKNGQEG